MPKCIICKAPFDDNTRSHTKLTCGIKCRKKRASLRMLEWVRTHRARYNRNMRRWRMNKAKQSS